MNKEELLKTFKELDEMQEKFKQIYEKSFGNRIGEEITNPLDIELFERIKADLYGILLAKHQVSERLSTEFGIFIM